MEKVPHLCKQDMLEAKEKSEVLYRQIIVQFGGVESSAGSQLLAEYRKLVVNFILVYRKFTSMGLSVDGGSALKVFQLR